MLDLVALQHALLVLEHGSFRKAAEALGVRPSVISRHIRKLEDTIGVSLFQRQSRGAQPTHAGVRILSRGRDILDEVESLLRTAAFNSAGSDGTLCVGVVSSIAGGIARQLLKTFLAGHVGVELEIVEGSPRDHIAAVRALRMDLTFVVGTPPAPGCEVERLWSEQIVVVLPANHPLALLETLGWAQIAEERFIVSKIDPGPEIHDFVVKNLSALGRHAIVESRPVRREGLMAMVGLGRGISLVGEAEAAVAYPDVVFRVLADEELPFSAVWSAQNDNPVFRRFLSLARKQLQGVVRPTGAPADSATSTTADGPSRTRDPSP